MWFQHLQTVQEKRKRGASKAVKTRKERKLNKKTTKIHRLVTVLSVQLLTHYI